VIRKRTLGVYGNNIEIQAMSELFSRRIEVYAYDATPLNICQNHYDPTSKPVRISYHRGNNYNSIIPTLPDETETRVPLSPPSSPQTSNQNSNHDNEPQTTNQQTTQESPDEEVLVCPQCGQKFLESDENQIQEHLLNLCPSL